MWWKSGVVAEPSLGEFLRAELCRLADHVGSLEAGVRGEHREVHAMRVACRPWAAPRERLGEIGELTLDLDLAAVRVEPGIAHLVDRRAERLAEQAEHIQDVLGQHQDAVVAREAARQAYSRVSKTVPKHIRG